jgi:hypothetical protein
MKSSSRRKLMRIITKPIRFLIKAKDNYVKSMNNLADSAKYSNFMGLPSGAMPRSFSVGSSNYESEEDLRELIRSSSVNNTHSAMDLYMIKQQRMKMMMNKKVSSSGAVMKMGSRRVPRSFSVGMAKIDEETPYDEEARRSESSFRPY